MNHFIAPERRETETFTLRCPMPGDGDMLSEAANASYDHIRDYMPWAQPHLSPEEAERSMRRFRANYLSNQDFAILVVDPEGSSQLGGTGFHLREGPLGCGCAEIGMWIRSSHAGRGLGSSVLREMLRWGFDDWGFHRLSWHCSSRNTASARCAEKAGMELEGCLRQIRREPDGELGDTLVFAALRESWS